MPRKRGMGSPDPDDVTPKRRVARLRPAPWNAAATTGSGATTPGDLEAGDTRGRSEETAGSDRASQQWSRQWRRKKSRRRRAEEQARFLWEQRPLEERVLHLEDDARWWRSWYGKIRPFLAVLWRLRDFQPVLDTLRRLRDELERWAAGYGV